MKIIFCFLNQQRLCYEVTLTVLPFLTFGTNRTTGEVPSLYTPHKMCTDDSDVFLKQQQIQSHERSPTYIHLTQVVNVSCLLNQVVCLSLDRQRHTGALIAFNAHHTLDTTFDIFEILHCLQHSIKVPVNHGKTYQSFPFC